MSIEIIDILKPKNGLSFKLIEAIDISVSGYTSLADAVTHFATTGYVTEAIAGKQDTLTTAQLAAVNSGITSELVTQIGTNTTAIEGKADASDLSDLATTVSGKADATDLATTNATVATKASTTDLTTATDNLQAQIDNIVSGSTADSEVINARVGVDGTSYGTLKARLDAEENDNVGNIGYIKGTIYNTDNLLINAKIVKNKYYVSGAAYANASYSYAVVPMLAAKTYVLSRARYIAYSTGAAAAESTNDNYEFTPSADGDVYITFYNDPLLEWKVYEKGKDSTLVGTYQHPVLSPDILVQTTGNNKNKVMSQKAVTDAIDAAISGIENTDVDIAKINEVSIKDGTDLTPLVVESGSGYYDVTSNVITYHESASSKYFKLPITGGTTYILSDRKLSAITTDANGDVVDYSSDATKKIQTSATAVLLWVSYSTDYGLTRKIAKNLTLDTIADTVYLFDSNIEEANTESNTKLFEKTFELRDNSNVFDNCDFVENKYYANGFFSNASYSVFVLKAKAGTTYKFGCPMRFFYSIDSSEAIAQSTTAGYTYTPQADTTLYCTVNNSDSSIWKAVAGTDDITLTPAIGSNALNPSLIAQTTGTSKTLLMSQKAITDAINAVSDATNVSDKIYGKGFARTTGNLSDSGSFTLPATNIKKNNIYSFVGDITTFSKLLIGHALEGYSGSWAEITSTKLIVHNYFSEDTETEFTHGLTISGYIDVQIIVKGGNKADIVIYSNGNTFTQANVTWYGDGYGSTFAISSGSALTNCVFTWSSEDFRKSTWLFGDSYMGLSDTARWCKYLTDAGFDKNVLINAYAGEGSGASVTALNNMIEHYGIPQTIVWCLGMNDGSDSNSSTPSTTWANGISQVESICETYNITLILATIPTVPNINHEGKNNYVRNSGNRYIDFAAAVGADGTGAWRSGMLSSDNVHPTVAGAKALYHRAIADCPEITYSNP